MPEATTMQTWAPGGSTYQRIADRYNLEMADRIFQLKVAGDDASVNALLSDLRRSVPHPGGPDLEERTLDLFLQNVETDLQERTSGGWNKLKLPLTLVAVGILIWRLPAILKLFGK